MSKRKLKKFAEAATFENFIQSPLPDGLQPHPLQGNWNELVFRNPNPIVMELGCGKGEYTLGLAGANPDINYLGVDIKGARIWRGAKTATEKGMQNVAFLRSQAGLLEYYFGASEISSIWLTFPDPFPKNSKRNKRMTSPRFLDRYRKFLQPGGIIHLKTDNTVIFEYTLEVIEEEKHELLYHTTDLYNSGTTSDATRIQTFYESMFLAQGMKINYLQFRLRHAAG